MGTEMISLRAWLGIGALLLAVAVILGAFGAHGLKNVLDSYSRDIFEKAVFYHFIHALGILVVVIIAKNELENSRSIFGICSLLTFGIVFFSGSLYLLAITGHKWLGAITPLGGTAFIIAWIWLALLAFRN